MFSLYLECAAEQQDELSAELYGRGTLGIIELPSGLRAWFDDGVEVDDLIASYDGEVTVETLTDYDWVRHVEESFPPFPIGRRFWLSPPWNHDPAPEGRIRLEILPGAACGTGRHECTQMCLEALERLVTPGCSMLDVGTGSGILSVAAALLGAGHIVSCDIDPDVVPIAEQRIGRRTAYVGSADAAATAVFDIVVANISPEAVRALMPDFQRTAKPSGNLILSGFGDYPLDIPPPELTRRGEWLCAVLPAAAR